MRHKYGYNKLGRKSSHRKAMLINLAESLVEHERITTTLPKAKELRRVVEKVVTLGKKGEVHHRRVAGKVVRSKTLLKKVFDDIAPRMAERPGGYTRILKRGVRFGDGAELATIEFVDFKRK